MDERWSGVLTVCVCVLVVTSAGAGRASVSALAEVLWAPIAPGICGFLAAATGPPPHTG